MRNLDDSRPNILVVLFDCLRALDFPGGAEAVDGMPFARQLMKESIVFPRAISPAPWTIPSHAGLFTGLYPWECNVHAFQSLSLDPTVPTLGTALHSVGYRSLSLSANPFISPRFGLVNGFDEAAWGGWWEAFLRSPRETAPNEWMAGSADTPRSQDRILEWIRDGPLGNLLRSGSQQSLRFPFALDTGNRLLQKVRAPDANPRLSQASWIEPVLDRWLRRQSASQPVFTFLNLTDTHEPYYPDPALVRGFRDWWRLAQTRQDHANAVGGRWLPTESQRQKLRTLYRQSVSHLDSRLEAIVRCFRENGRWENTWMFVTSDHGQALGEHGMMFHLLRLDEPLLRIPLWMRPPRGTGEGREAEGWANLIDIFPTIVSAAGAVVPDPPSAVSLAELVDYPRSRPVFAMADGIVWDHIRKRFNPAREAEWDEPLVASYSAGFKVIMKASGASSRAFDIEHDPKEEHPVNPNSDAPLLELVKAARKVGTEMLHSNREVDESLEERLRSWGYV